MAASLTGMSVNMALTNKFSILRQKCFTSRHGISNIMKSQIRLQSGEPSVAVGVSGGEEEDEFRVLVIPGHTKVPESKRQGRFTKTEARPPRYKTIPINQDWTSVWPSAQTFKWSVVPLPIRQGYLNRKTDNDGIPPGKYANSELMKIPNFFHLTPNHIKKQCQALKPLCNDWPTGLETDERCEKHFPVEVITRDYITDGPSLRDPRARLVTYKVKLSALELDYHARDKLLRLLGDHYDPKTDIITLNSDRCPLKQQNYDYTLYLLTACYFESWKTEPWENEKEEADMETYVWEKTKSKPAIIHTVKCQKQFAKNADPAGLPEHLSQLPAEDPSEEDIVSLDSVKEYKQAIEELHNIGEDFHSLNKYKEASARLLLGQVGTPR